MPELSYTEVLHIYNYHYLILLLPHHILNQVQCQYTIKQYWYTMAQISTKDTQDIILAQSTKIQVQTETTSSNKCCKYKYPTEIKQEVFQVFTQKGL